MVPHAPGLQIKSYVDIVQCANRTRLLNRKIQGYRVQKEVKTHQRLLKSTSLATRSERRKKKKEEKNRVLTNGKVHLIPYGAVQQLEQQLVLECATSLGHQPANA